mmetsp:Transcript_109165/g.315409  ORF Transcript_109165/g.315409 Transcript_109165/m.315409 type:complete len:273 (+) Transcript_109165:191-1009(+)
MRPPTPSPSMWLLHGGRPLLPALALGDQHHKLLEGRPVLGAAHDGRVVMAAVLEGEVLQDLGLPLAQDVAELAHLHRRDDLIIQTAQQAARPRPMVLGDEIQAGGRVPRVEDHRWSEQDAHRRQEREHLQRHVAQRRERVLEDQACWQRQAAIGSSNLPLLQQVRHQMYRNSSADGSAEEQDAIFRHPGDLLLLRISDALDQPPVCGHGVHHEARLGRAGAIFRVAVRTVVEDQNIGIQLLAHGVDVLKTVPDIARVTVAIKEGEGNRILAL